jgi:hypothetical protein
MNNSVIILKQIFMKRFFYILVLMFSMTGNMSIQAQNRFPLLRERINQAKLREMRFKLDLDQVTFQKFSPIYLRYEDEISSLNVEEMSGLMRINADSLTSEQADQLFTNQIEVARKMIGIREKYFKEFKTVLKSQQIIKLFQTEAELRRKVMGEIKRRTIEG